ncbi:MAG: hypothetical protein AVDCRST_MAG93-7090, partial [uncultured Chloroflexia bacterium]
MICMIVALVRCKIRETTPAPPRRAEGS